MSGLEPTIFDTAGHADGMPRAASPQADWVGVDPALRREVGARLEPGERVEWVQQARPHLPALLLRECHDVWGVATVLIILLGVALPLETVVRPDGGTILRMGGIPAFLWKDGDISALRDGAVVGVICFLAGLLRLAWRAYKLSRLWKEVYAITNRRFLYLHPFLLDFVVDEAPLSQITVLNRAVETPHRADIFISHPRTVTTNYNAGAENAVVIETIRLRGILSPDSVEAKLRSATAGR